MVRFPRWLRLSCFGLGTFLLLLMGWVGVKFGGVQSDWLAYYSAGYAVLTHNLDRLYDLASAHSVARSLYSAWDAAVHFS